MPTKTTSMPTKTLSSPSKKTKYTKQNTKYANQNKKYVNQNTKDAISFKSWCSWNKNVNSTPQQRFTLFCQEEIFAANSRTFSRNFYRLQKCGGVLDMTNMRKFRNFHKIQKFAQNSAIWSKLWNLVKILKIWLKFWNMVKILIFNRNCEIW